MALDEFELIEKYFHRQLGGYGVLLGIGDDCALLQIPEGKALATSMDTLVADRHFPGNGDPELIAQRALRVNLSDLAAMGAEPLWFTLGLTLPSADPYWLEGFSRGLQGAADQFRCTLVGGDTTRGPLTITIQVMGAVEPKRALTRGNARPGDIIYVTGTVGDGAAALAVLQREFQVGKAAFDYFMAHYYRPLPRLREAQALAGIASAAIDVSDGLLQDLGHICEASGVGAVLQVERLPLSEALAKLAGFEQSIEWALAGGDDYQLCFTVSQQQRYKVEKLIADRKLTARAIGMIDKGRGVKCVHKGQPYSVKNTGYRHFDTATDT
ncbi:thiamine-phosphate kinase [Gilvimarinus sp. F26214L]|uniref:thiamine-phosphate kinase n=1 Tax=Gilvimarinus sp. DZF01 TaxID=3461371 RepID=UPI004045EBA5